MTVKTKAAVMMVAVTMMMVFMTTTTASEGRSFDHIRQKRAQCSGSSKVPVKICVRTSTGSWVQARGTDSDVRVRLLGAKCQSTWQNLDDPYRDDFEQGDYDCFTYNTQDVGTPVNSIEVKTDPFNDNWLLDSIVLKYNNVSTCLEFYVRWWFRNTIPKTFKEPKSVACSSHM